MSCAHPIAWDTLVDYWARDLGDADTAAVEEHFYGCGDCAAAAARVAAVTETLRAALPPVVSRARVEQLRARGVRIRETTFAPGDQRDVRFVADADLLVHRLGGLDLTGAERVSVRISAESTGALIMEVDGPPFEPAEGAVLVACERHNVAFPHDTVMSVSIHVPGDAPPRTATYTIRHLYE